MKPTDLVSRADALLTEPSGDSPSTTNRAAAAARRALRAGSVLTRVVVALALLTVLGAAACAVLAWLGIWRPLVALPVLLVLLAVAVRVSAVVPGRPLPVWSAATLVTISVAATVWAGVTHSEQVLPRRDPGSYYQSAVNLAEHHRSPIVVPAATIGGPEVLDVPGVTLASPAFYQTGTAAQPSVQPQFVIGPSAWYSVGHWLGGPGAMLWVPAVFGGLGVLALGLLTSAVVGPRWGPLGAFATAICFPLLHVNRSTYSEPLALFVLAAGLLVLVAATDRGARGHAQHARVLGFVAGVLIGGGGLVRVDALRETVLLLPVAALMMIRRDGAGAALLGGAAVATGVSALAALALSGQYLGSIAGSLLPLVALGVVLALAAAGVVVLARRGVRLPGAVRRRLAPACAALVLLAGVVLATRPLWHVEHQSAADPGSRVVAGLQLRQGLPVDGGRTYAEQSLGWTAWWTRAGGRRGRLPRPRLRRAPAGHRVGPGVAAAGVDRPLPGRPGVGAAHLGPSGHHPGPPVGRPPPVHRPAVRDRRRGDGGRVADPLVHTTDATGCPRGRQRGHGRAAARARGAGHAAARRRAGRGRLPGGRRGRLPEPAAR